LLYEITFTKKIIWIDKINTLYANDVHQKQTFETQKAIENIHQMTSVYIKRKWFGLDPRNHFTSPVIAQKVSLDTSQYCRRAKNANGSSIVKIQIV
jgi:hypothetical protein